MSSSVHRLHYGKTPLADVVPDNHWPNMWRIAWPDGCLSDMANLSRARDAAQAIAERGPPARNRTILRWVTVKHVEEAVGRFVARSKEQAA